MQNERGVLAQVSQVLEPRVGWWATGLMTDRPWEPALAVQGTVQALAAAVPTLPILRAAGIHKEWDSYLSCVYGGPLHHSAYPLDLNTFEWFYEGAPFSRAVQPIDATPYDTVAPGTAWVCRRMGKPPESAICLDWAVSRRLHGFFVQRFDRGTMQWRSGGDGTVDRMQWIEVLHAAIRNGATGGGSAGLIGTWYYRARGSGIWLNSGKATRVLHGRNASKMTHLEPLHAMRRHGVQTIQAPVSQHGQGALALLTAAYTAAHRCKRPAACSGLPPGPERRAPAACVRAEKSLRWRVGACLVLPTVADSTAF